MPVRVPAQCPAQSPIRAPCLVPAGLVVKNGSKICSMILGGNTGTVVGDLQQDAPIANLSGAHLYRSSPASLPPAPAAHFPSGWSEPAAVAHHPREPGAAPGPGPVPYGMFSCARLACSQLHGLQARHLVSATCAEKSGLHSHGLSERLSERVRWPAPLPRKCDAPRARLYRPARSAAVFANSPECWSADC